MNQKLNVLMWVFALVVILGFFLPWVQVHMGLSGSDRFQTFKEILKKEPLLPQGKMVLSGYDIPVVATSSEALLVNNLITLLLGPSDNIALKSSLVYLVPILAVICGLLGLLSIQGRFYSILLILISGGISGGGYYKLREVSVENMLVDVEFQLGLYIVLGCFGIIALIGLIKAFIGKKI